MLFPNFFHLKTLYFKHLFFCSDEKEIFFLKQKSPKLTNLTHTLPLMLIHIDFNIHTNENRERE